VIDRVLLYRGMEAITMPEIRRTTASRRAATPLCWAVCCPH